MRRPRYRIDVEMGSDDGKKQRMDGDRQSWLAAGMVLLLVIAALAMVQYRIRQPLPMARDVEEPKNRVEQHSRGSLKEQLLDLAMLPAEEALAALDRDPLGVDATTNASEWSCPAERLVHVGPSLAAERGVRAQSPGHFLWFEHLSKSGGTSFCDFARKNVGLARTPRYYCMPSEGARITGTDGRVGRWLAGRLHDYVQRTGHVVLANEWDAFPAQQLLETDLKDKVVLAAVLRDPVDRLVSAYKFWGKLHNPNPNPKPAADWLEDRDRIARRRPHRLYPDDFLSQVARRNFAVWKFASSARADLDDCGDNSTCDREALAIALDRLEQFHIAVPMLWQHAAAPLYRRLGWTHTDPVHRVPSGRIQNTDAREELGARYDAFRAQNLLDFLLWTFARRAFLERLHCSTP